MLIVACVYAGMVIFRYVLEPINTSSAGRIKSLIEI